jgi:hypothetical protein
MVKQKRTTKENRLWAKIHAIDTKTLVKMQVAEFCGLLEQANQEQQKSLFYKLNRAGLEQTIRGVVREELAKMNLEKDAAREERVAATFKRINADLKLDNRRRRVMKTAKR